MPVWEGGKEGGRETLQTPVRGKEGEEEGRKLSRTVAKKQHAFAGASVFALFPSNKSKFSPEFPRDSPVSTTPSSAGPLLAALQMQPSAAQQHTAEVLLPAEPSGGCSFTHSPQALLSPSLGAQPHHCHTHLPSWALASSLHAARRQGLAVPQGCASPGWQLAAPAKGNKELFGHSLSYLSNDARLPPWAKLRSSVSAPGGRLDKGQCPGGGLW